jgi:hypothetical protein
VDDFLGWDKAVGMSFCRTILLPLALVVGVAALATGCSVTSSPRADAQETTDTSQDELTLQNRTFNVMRSGDGCKLPFRTLFVKRGGRVTFDNGTWIPGTTEVTSDDNVSLLLDWPNALGEDSATSLDITIGEKRSTRVPYLDDELYGDSSSLDFDLYCVPEGSDWGQPVGKVRIFR